MTEFWTAARVDQFKNLYYDPREYSFSEIAAKLGGGISRNGCIGKAHRLGFDRRGVGRKPQIERPTKRVAAQGVGAAVQKINQAKAKPERTTQFQLPKAPKVKPEPFVMQCAEVVPLGIGLMDLTETTCRWPDDATKGSAVSHVFCGHPTIAGRPYCGVHARIAWRAT